MVPCPTNIMEMLPDPYSAEIKVATVYAANINWATLPHTSWAMPGGFPLFMDRRFQQAKDCDTFPSSWQIRTFCYEFLKGCLHNPALTDEETATIILDPTQPPPSDPNGVIRSFRLYALLSRPKRFPTECPVQNKPTLHPQLEVQRFLQVAIFV